MNTLIVLLALLLADDIDDDIDDRQCVVVVVGAPGTPDFGEGFRRWADRWADAARRGGARFLHVGLDEQAAAATSGLLDRDRLRELLAGESRRTSEPLWLVLIGHGTFDGQQAKFNLRGPDVTATELAKWIEPLERPLAVVNCASSSGPFVNRLSAPNRVVVTATKSGHEHNYARFGGKLAAAITDPAADLDKDGQTSLLEAYVAASARVAEFYRQEGRLATEHSLIDDNGDGRGTPAAWFRGIRATRQAKDGASPDGLRANQFHLVRSPRDRDMPADVRTKRDELELAVARLRGRKGDLKEDEYYELLEPLLLDLARLYEKVDASE